jgi:hypothetical protein
LIASFSVSLANKLASIVSFSAFKAFNSASLASTNAFKSSNEGSSVLSVVLATTSETLPSTTEIVLPSASTYLPFAAVV